MNCTVLVIGAEVRRIRSSQNYVLLLTVEQERKLFTCIHSVSADRDSRDAHLRSRTEKFGDPLQARSSTLKRLQRPRAVMGDTTTGIVSGWRVTRHRKHGIQAWAMMELGSETSTPHSVPVLVDEEPLGDMDEEKWSEAVNGTIAALAQAFALRSVWPIRVGYHGKYVPDVPPDADEPGVAAEGGGQLQAITAW